MHGGTKVDKENINIESYDEADAYYEGSDKDYEEFLKQVDGDTHTSEEAKSVTEDTSADVGETINIKGVIDMVRKKAGEFGNAAKKFGGDMKVQFNDYIAAANERAEEKKAEILDAADNLKEDISDKVIEVSDESGLYNVSAAISNTAKSAKEHIKSAQNSAKEKLSSLSSPSAVEKGISEILEKLNAADAKIRELEAKEAESRSSYDNGINDLRVSITSINNDLTEIKQNTSSITKLNDSIFDIKNTQQNTKKSLYELSERILVLKKKLVAGITVVSILSVMVIVLEIINLLS